MCVDLSPPAPPSAGLHDAEIADPIMLDPVDSVEIVSLMDNVTDVFMPDQGPARRADFVLAARRDCGVMAGGTVPDALVAEHGFSMLITVRKGDRTHRILFDTGISPDGVVANMRRLDIDPGSIEAIICSHGHFDHTTGLDGLAPAVAAWRRPAFRSSRTASRASCSTARSWSPARYPGSADTSPASRRSRRSSMGYGNLTRWSWMTRRSLSASATRAWSYSPAAGMPGS